MTEASPVRVEAVRRQTALIAGAIAASLPMYVVVVEWLGRSVLMPIDVAGFATLRIALFVMVGVVIFATTVLKGVMLRNPPADGAARLTRLRTATVVSLALSEVPAAVGLVVFLVGRARGDFYILLAISAYMLARHFPRRSAWEAYASGSSGVR
jgi:hypothetical protein